MRAVASPPPCGGVLTDYLRQGRSVLLLHAAGVELQPLIAGALGTPGRAVSLPHASSLASTRTALMSAAGGVLALPYLRDYSLNVIEAVGCLLAEWGVGDRPTILALATACPCGSGPRHCRCACPRREAWARTLRQRCDLLGIADWAISSGLVGAL
jgi:hypothetical protein